MKDYLGPSVFSMVLYECIREIIRTDELNQRRVSDTEDRRREGKRKPPLIHLLPFA
jgi:hypothetical protein